MPRVLKNGWVRVPVDIGPNTDKMIVQLAEKLELPSRAAVIRRAIEHYADSEGIKVVGD